MAWVTVLPLGVEIEVGDGQTIFEAAIAQGYHWPTVCQGLGACRTCYMQVIDGAHSLGDPDDWEREGLDDLAGRSAESRHLRLACQAQVHGDVVVRKSGVRVSRAPAEAIEAIEAVPGPQDSSRNDG